MLLSRCFSISSPDPDQVSWNELFSFMLIQVRAIESVPSSLRSLLNCLSIFCVDELLTVVEKANAYCSVVMYVRIPVLDDQRWARYGLDNPEILFRWRRGFTHFSRPALQPIQPPIHWSWVISGGKVAEVWR